MPGPTEHPFCGLLPEGLGTVRVSRVWPQGRANNSSTGGKGSPRPPDVKRRDMAVPNCFLASGVRRDPLDWKINLDKALRVALRRAHFVSPLRIASGPT